MSEITVSGIFVTLHVKSGRSVEVIRPLLYKKGQECHQHIEFSADILWTYNYKLELVSSVFLCSVTGDRKIYTRVVQVHMGYFLQFIWLFEICKFL